MTERISVGDLVVVVRIDGGCIHAFHFMGRIFTVISIRTDYGVMCYSCRQRDIAKDGEAHVEYRPGNFLPMRWLKRIPPLSELEREQTDAKEPVSRLRKIIRGIA